MARRFSKEEIEDIKRQLEVTSVKDSDLQETQTITGDDYVAIVQEGKNRLLNVNTFRSALKNGPQGESTYDIAVRHGFVGTEEDWIAIPQSGQITLVNNGTITNAEDEEDITSDGELLKFADRPVAYGMGYVILRRNKTFEEQVTQENTIYEIRYDFDLDESTVTIPENSELRFNGGSVDNGTLEFDISNTITGNPKIYCSVSGKLKSADITWFGAESGDTDGDISEAIEKSESISDCIIIPEGTFYIKTAAVINPSVNRRQIDWLGSVIYNGSATSIDVFTINLGGVGGVLNMSGSLSASGISQVTADRFKIKGLVFKNCKRGDFHLGWISNFNVGVMVIGKGAGCSSNTFYISRVQNCNEGLLITQDNDGNDQGWANENLFIGGSINVSSTWDLSTKACNYIWIGSLYETDTYKNVNNLVFIKQNLECPIDGLIPIYAENWTDSTIFKSRFEIQANASGEYIGCKFVGACGRLAIDSGYKVISYDLSELETTNNNVPLIYGGFDHSVEIGEGLCSGAYDASSGDFYPDSVMFKGQISSNSLSLVSGAPIAHTQYGDLGMWGVKLTFLRPGSFNRLFIRVSNDSDQRRDVYVKGIETFDGTSVVDSTVIRHANSLTLRESRDYWVSGTSLSTLSVVFNENIKTVIIAFNNINSVSISGASTFSLDSQHLLHSGATESRPSYKYTGYQFFDTDLGKVICWNGSEWINVDGTSLT